MCLCMTGPCKCNSYRHRGPHGRGDCSKQSRSSRYCYVDHNSSCPDKRRSFFGARYPWSRQACNYRPATTKKPTTKKPTTKKPTSKKPSGEGRWFHLNISKMFLFLGNSCRCGVENKGGGSRRSRNRIAGGAEIDQVQQDR